MTSRELRRRQVDWQRPMEVVRQESALLESGESDTETQGASVPASIPSAGHRSRPKEIVVPAGEKPWSGETVDPGVFVRPKRVRWRPAGFTYESTSFRDDDPQGPEVHYHVTLKDEELLREINGRVAAGSSSGAPLVTIEQLRRAFDTLEKATGPSRQLVDHGTAVDHLQRRFASVDAAGMPAYILIEMYTAWVRRREENKGKAMLRMFWAVGTQGEDPQMNNTLRINTNKLRLRRHRRNSDMLLNKARELHKECLAMLQYANSAYIGERLKRQRLLALQALSKRRDAAVKETAALKAEVSAFRDEQRQLALREEALAKSQTALAGTGGSGRSGQQKRKLVYVTEEKSGGGGMLGGLAGSRRGSAGEAGETRTRAKTRMRIREGRSHRWYMDSVNEVCDKFLPTFAQYEAFGSFEALGGDSEVQAAEYAENFLDEIYDNLRTLKIGDSLTPGLSAEAAASLLADLRRSTNQR